MGDILIHYAKSRDQVENFKAKISSRAKKSFWSTFKVFEKVPSSIPSVQNSFLSKLDQNDFFTNFLLDQTFDWPSQYATKKAHGTFLHKVDQKKKIGQ